MGTLAALGISEGEENVYRWLLSHPGASPPEVSKGAGIALRSTSAMLHRLESLTLLTRSPERTVRYIATAPELALESLMAQRHEELRRARASIHELQKLAVATSRQEPLQLVELMTNQESARLALDQMQRMATDEVVWLVRPPVLVSRLDAPIEEERAVQREAMAKGVRYRSIVDRAFLELPNAAAATKDDMLAGEDVRVASSLPFKMVLADRRIALIPLNPEESNSQALIVRSSALLDALYALFELLWDRAVPLTPRAAHACEVVDPAMQTLEEATDILMRMASGRNDKSIAHELKISTRTLNRRLSFMMDATDTQTRFQLGWIAALKLSAQTLAAERDGPA
jgi:sugar-specific transcriptional regulator TrmB